MKICFVCSEYPPGPHGGIGTMTQELARALVARGHQVRAIGLYRNLPAQKIEDDQGVQVFRLPLPQTRGGWTIGRYHLFRTIRRWARDGDIDLVEVPDWEGMAAFWPRLNVPVVARFHGSATYFAHEAGTPLSSRQQRLDQTSAQRANYRVSVSDYTARISAQLFGLPDVEMVIHNFVHLPEPVQQTGETHKVIFTGRLIEKKGVTSLVKAWPLILERFPSAELHLYGADSLNRNGQSTRAILEALLTDTEYGQVYFHGHVSRGDLFPILLSARAAVFPSYAEAFALAPLEAMGCGCPTIYTRRGSGPELIDHDHDGLLIDPDQPEQIADAICALLSDDALAARLGEAGRAKVQACFSPDVIVPQNEQFYTQCLERFHDRH